MMSRTHTDRKVHGTEGVHADDHPGGGRSSKEASVCHLVRPDGSTWRVDELTFTRHGLRVDADRIASSDAGRASLADAYLEAGDRLEWLDDEGRVVWSHHNPVDGG